MEQQLFNVVLFDNDGDVLSAASTHAASHAEAVKTVTDHFVSKGADVVYTTRRIRRITVEIDD